MRAICSRHRSNRPRTVPFTMTEIKTLRRLTPLLSLLWFGAQARSDAAPDIKPMPAILVQPRDGLGHVMGKLRTGEPVKIAYFGGSITAYPGWRVMTREWFQKTFPRARVSEIQAAIGGTGSDLGNVETQ